jgi:hypothetical protein
LTTRFLYLGAEIFFFLFFSGTLRPRYSTSPHCATAQREKETRQRDTSIHHLRVREREREKEPMFLAIYFKHIRRKRGKTFAFVLFNATHTVLPPSIEGKLSRDKKKKKINIKGENGPIIKARTSQ